MTEKTSEKPDPAPGVLDKPGTAFDGSCDVLVCIDETGAWRGSILHAQAVASSFGGKVVLVKVIETPEQGMPQPDPVDWEIQKRMARTKLKNLAKEYSTPECAVEIRTLEGNLIDQMCACASQKPHDITAVSGNGGAKGRTFRHNMRRLVDFDIGPVLLTPPNVELSKPVIMTRG